ncbi:MAG: hypothetical protein JSR18_04820 [Proteobacteria bacterium]|nr:hypothetical protein [Pseudomonadota bacterium]
MASGRWLSEEGAAAIAARIRTVEMATGAEVVAAIAGPSSWYHGLRWRAFALGAVVAALVGVVADLAAPQWLTAHAALAAAALIVGIGLACALVATLVPGFARLFLQRVRAEAEVRQRAEALFLRRQLFATARRNAILLYAGTFERAIAVLPDRGYDGVVAADEWNVVVAAMTPRFRAGDARDAFLAGLAALEGLLLAKGMRGGGDAANVLGDQVIEVDGDDA